MAANLSGTTIKGYELHERVGAGGMGAVYRAYQQEIGREVAIKVILPEYADHPDFVRRFTTEAQVVARLEHPHIMPLYDYWREPGHAYLVMRWLRRGNLTQALNAEALTVSTATKLFYQVATALGFAHEHGVIHRDLKPDNVMLDDHDNAYLADFGIAKDLRNASAMTQDGDMVGTLAYMSPEQMMGHSASPQSDIYSLGIMLYELLVGEHPFGRDVSPSALIFKHIHEALPDLHVRNPELSEEMNRVIQRATSKDLTERYPNIATFLSDFHRAAGMANTPVRESVFNLFDGTAIIRSIEQANPYKGLRAFQEADANDFFGREALTQQVLGLLNDENPLSRFLAVVGPSGSGKSSVVKAGLIPALRKGGLAGSENWFVADIRPGTHPFEELEVALLRIAINPPESLLKQLEEDERGFLRAARRTLPADGHLVLVIDQFEELYTMVEDAAVRDRFLDSLYTTVTDPQSPVYLIITLRADYYDQPLMHPKFSELVSKRTQVVVPLTPEEIERAITHPARRVGVMLEPGLSAAMIAEVSGRPGVLPLLQYALTELFEHLDGNQATLAAYREIGGVMGALARRADEVYNQLDERSKEAAQQIFLRLIALGQGDGNTRRRVLREELMGIGEDRVLIEHVLDVLGQSRLLSFDHHPETRQATVEIAHESILNEWEQLREWVEASRADVQMQRILSTVTADWLEANRDPSFLLRGSRLEQFTTWADETALNIVADERRFLDASREQHEQQQAAEKQQQAREAMLEARSRRNLRLLVGVLLVAALVAFGLATVAFSQSQVASANAATADRSADESQSLALAIGAQQAISQGQPDAAITLALEANRLFNPPPEARRALADSADFSWIRNRFLGHTGNVWSVAYSPDGKTALSGGADGKVIQWDVATGQSLQTLAEHTTDVYGVAFSPDSKLALSGAAGGDLLLWNLETGALLHRLEGHTADVITVRFSPDGETALSTSVDTSLILWDVASGEMVRRLEGHTSDVWGVAYSPDGMQALSGAGDQLLILWELETGEVIRTFEGHSDVVSTVGISPDGRLGLSGSWDGTLRLWNLETGETIHTLAGHNTFVWSSAFSPDGRTVLSGADDTTLILWDVETGSALRQMRGHQQGVFNLAFSPDGQMALSVSDDTSPILWDMSAGSLVRRFTGHVFDVRHVAYSPDGQRALSSSDDSTLILWDMNTGAQLQTFNGHTSHVHSAVFTPDGANILSGASDNTLILWDVASGEALRTFSGHTAAVESIALSPDAATVVSASDDTTLILWDVASGEALRTFSGHSAPVLSVAFSPDGTRLLSGARDATMRLWDVATGEIVRQYRGHTADVTSVAFSPDGTLLLSGSRDTTMRLWEAESPTLRQRFQGHTADVNTVAFSPDGTRILSGAADTTVLLWDMTTADILRRFQGHTSQVFSVAFSPDGQTALSGSDDSTMILWKVEPYEGGVETWIQANRYVRAVSCEQRLLYRIEPLCENTDE